MAELPNIAKVLPWLDKSGLKDTNLPLYQVIRALIYGQLQTGQVVSENASGGGGGGSTNAITALTGDVVATGPGAVPAVIQPNVVTYAKIQQTTGSDVLIGRADTPGNVEEITLGANLVIEDGQLEIETPEGTLGFEHPLLSLSHNDTTPFSPPEPGDMIVAFENVNPVSDIYIDGFSFAPLIQDFIGAYVAMLLGMPNGLIAPNSGAYSTQPFDYVIPDIDDYRIRLIPEIIDAFSLAPLVEDFIGSRQGYTALVPGGTIPSPGNYGAYSPPVLTLIEPPVPTPEITGLWYRIAIGENGSFLRVNNGTPTWVDPTTTISITTTGTVNNLDFVGSNIIYLDNASLLTINGITPGPVTPFGVAGNKIPLYDGQQVTFISRGAGNVYFAHENTGATGENRLTNWITSGITPLAAGTGRATYTYDLTANRWKLTEHQQGGMITVPFSAGLFTAATGVWTVAAGDVPEDVAYKIDGKAIRVQMRVVTSTTSLATATLSYTLPNGWTAGRRTNSIGFGIVAGILESILTFVSAAGATTITFTRMNGAGNFPAETDTLAAICNLDFDIT